MDKKDIDILRYLATDSRLSLGDIAEKTGLAVSTVHKRINKLIKEEYIEKFTIILNPEKFGCVTAFLLIDCESDKIKEIANEICKEESIIEVYESLGTHNIIAKIRAESLDRLKEAVNRVSDIEGVYNFEIYLSTTRYKEETWKPDNRR
jgi:DNA-binding Lrp family transcriptional regulator